MTNLAITEDSNPIPTPLIFTDSAAVKVYELIKEEGNMELKLRVFVTGGGCSGLQYGFSFDEEIAGDDIVIKKVIHLNKASDAHPEEEEEDDDGEGGSSGGMIIVMLLIDAMSFPYLEGAEIDYRKDLNGEQFVIRNNPNAKTTCGCGSSFSAE